VSVFFDLDSNLIAFNLNTSLYFNLRYYSQCHYKHKTEEEALRFWFVIFCHELAHNVESNHNKQHESAMEILIVNHLSSLCSLVGQEEKNELESVKKKSVVTKATVKGRSVRQGKILERKENESEIVILIE
jgi:hypothetical protein